MSWKASRVLRARLGRSVASGWTLWVAALLAVSTVRGPGAEAPKTVLRTEHFDQDPGWEGRNNQMEPRKVRPVQQDFGFRASHFAGAQAGELGGVVWRATRPAFYAARLAPKTLQDKLSASGTLAFTASAASSGIFFGWFNSHQPGGSRPMQSLGLDFDGEKHGLRLAVRLITGSNQSCGTFITPFIPGKFRPTPIRNDGTRYHWNLSYDPEANAGHGQVQFSIRSQGERHEEFEGRVFRVDLPPGFKEQQMVLDRFGLMNGQRPGGGLTVYFDDLQFDGRTEAFATDPGWEGSGNRISYQPEDVGGVQRFGFSPDTAHAGGSPGEIGGVLWRTEKNPAYYADRVGSLSLDQPLEASGRVCLAVGAPDSAACLGWFNSATTNAAMTATNFLGLLIEGPTRIGHYFRPRYATAQGRRGMARTGPVIVPGQALHWSLSYQPGANGGAGAIRVTLQGESVTLNLKPGERRQGAGFNRFGLCSTGPGGSLVKLYLDDLSYTAAGPKAR